MRRRKGLRSSIYRRAIAAILGCGLATAAIVLGAGEYFFRDAYAAARESSLKEARDRFAIYDFFVAGLEASTKARTEAALRDLGALYPDSSSIGRADAASLRAAADRLGVTEIYLVDSDGFIRATTYAPDAGLNILAPGLKSTAGIRSLYGAGRIAHQGLSQSARSGEASSYHYYSAPGSDLLIEVSMGLREEIEAAYPGGYRAFLDLVVGMSRPVSAPRPLVRIDDLVGLTGGKAWSFAREGSERPALLPLLREADSAGGSARRVEGVLETLVFRVGPMPGKERLAGERRFAVLEMDLSPLRRFRVLVGLFAGAATLLCSGAAFSIAKRGLDRDVSERVERLEASIERIAMGDFRLALEAGDENVDEIGGIARGVAAMVRTIVERNDELAASLAEKDELLREVHHRVKNNLQIIDSLISLQIAESRDEAVAAALAETRARVYGMAVVHDELYKGSSLASVDLGACLSGIAADLAQSKRRPGLDVSVKVEAEGVFLPADLSLPACLAASELISGCYDRAFAGRGAGSILVRAAMAGESGFELSVEDDGREVGEACLGLAITGALAAQLRGTLRREAAAAGGERFVLRVPA